MDGSRFDRIVRTFGRGFSRRALFGSAVGIAAMRPWRISANQLTPATCGAAGDACTQLLGCCDGFTCATSAINVNYGVCIPGDGGSVPVGTTLISPFSENADEEAAALAADNAATGSTDASGETETTPTSTTTTQDREARIVARDDSQAAQSDEQQLRRQTNKTAQRNRRRSNNNNNNQNKKRKPRLALEISNPGAAGSPAETLKVTNKDDRQVVLTRIEPLDGSNPGTDLLPPVPLDPGESFRFEPGQFGWTPSPICRADVSGDGFVVVAAASADSKNHRYTRLCDRSSGGGNGNRKRKKNRQSGGSGKSRRNKKNKKP